MINIHMIIRVVLYIVLAPLVGGLLEGIDRKISARMQRRVGPPLLQPLQGCFLPGLRRREGRFEPSQRTRPAVKKL